jgi:hypothetical protein
VGHAPPFLFSAAILASPALRKPGYDAFIAVLRESRNAPRRNPHRTYFRAAGCDQRTPTPLDVPVFRGDDESEFFCARGRTVPRAPSPRDLERGSG